MIALKFLPRCTAFFNQIPIESLKICNSNAIHLGKKFLTAIFSAIFYSVFKITRILTLSDLGDLKHSMPEGGADSAPLFISVVA